MFIRNLKILGAAVPEKSDEKFYWRKRKKGQIKGMISMRMLILSYTIQVIPNVCIKILDVPEKSLKKVYTHTQT